MYFRLQLCTLNFQDHEKHQQFIQVWPHFWLGSFS